MKALAMRGVGVAFLTEINVLFEIKAGDLVYVPLEEPSLRPSTLTICAAADRHPSPAAALLLEHFSEALAKLQ